MVVSDKEFELELDEGEPGVLGPDPEVDFPVGASNTLVDV